MKLVRIRGNDYLSELGTILGDQNQFHCFSMVSHGFQIPFKFQLKGTDFN